MVGLWISCPAWEEWGAGPKAGKTLCGLDSSWSAPQVPWLNSATGFTLRMIYSAFTLSTWVLVGYTAFQVFWLGFLAEWSQELHSAVTRVWLSSPAWVGGGSRLQGWQDFSFENLKSGRVAPCWVLWSYCTIAMALLRSKAPGWDHYLDAAGLSWSECWLLHLHAFSVTIKFPQVKCYSFSHHCDVRLE